jgi:hypothetical protein
METCPACKAPFKGRQTCHRCKSDLRPLIAVEERSAACLAAARAAFEQNDYQAARSLACQTLALKRSQEAESLYRYAGLLSGRRRRIRPAPAGSKRNRTTRKR